MASEEKHQINTASPDELPNNGLPVLQDNFFTRAIDSTIKVIGDVFSWLWFALLIVIIINVILRYVFSQGMIELEELQWYLYAAAWLTGLSYTFVYDGHVRVDVLTEKFSWQKKLWLELFGLIIFFMPFICLVFYFSLSFVALSWATGETSTSANGLPARWLIKGCLTFSFVLLFLVGFSRIVKVLKTLKEGPVNFKSATSS